MTSGWSAGDLVIVAGRPSMGKSVIGMQRAHTSACQGIGVAYLSLEMSKESLVRRLIAGLSRVDSHRARSGYLSADERRRALIFCGGATCTTTRVCGDLLRAPEH